MNRFSASNLIHPPIQEHPTSAYSTPTPQPLVSVIIPCFNAESYIEETLQSILKSTYPKIEIIIIDDGSTDKTIRVIEDYQGNHANIKIIQQQNCGPGAARNAGVRMAKGEAIAFLDADDIWDATKIEKQMCHFKPGTLIYTDRINFGDLGGLSEKQSESVNQPEGSVFPELFLQGNFVTMSSVLLHKDDFQNAEGFDENPEIAGVADWDLWLRMARAVRFKFIPEPLTLYRCHESGMSKQIMSMHTGKQQVIDKFKGSVSDSELNAATQSALAGSAFFAKNQEQFLLALKFYCKCILNNPTNTSLYKQAIKCILRRI